MGTDPTGGYYEAADQESFRVFLDYMNSLDTESKAWENFVRLQNSDQKFMVFVDSAFIEGKEGGAFKYDGKNFQIILEPSKSGEIYSLFSRFTHEIKHGVQFLDSEINFSFDPIKNKWRPGNAYDIYDELAAHDAQYQYALDHNRKGDIRDLRMFARKRKKGEDKAINWLITIGYGSRPLERKSVHSADSYVGPDGFTPLYKPGQLVRTKYHFFKPPK